MTNYQTGLEVLKSLYLKLKSPFKYDQFLDSIGRDSDGSKIPDDDLKEWITMLGSNKVLFLKIPWKSSSDYDSILQKIASKTPFGKLPTRKMVDSAFLNPNTFKPDLIDYSKMLAKAVASTAKSVTKATVGTAEFIGEARWLLLAGGLMYLASKLLGQSDKISSAYRAVKGDVGSAYNRVSSDAAKAYSARKNK